MGRQGFTNVLGVTVPAEVLERLEAAATRTEEAADRITELAAAMDPPVDQPSEGE